MINPVTKRFYWLMLQQDLFGSWCVRKVSGGLSNNHCRETWLPFNTEKEASRALADAEYIKRQKGYNYADVEGVDYFPLRPQTIA